MSFHASYHLTLSASETTCYSDQTTTPHLSFERASDSTRQKNRRGICQIPKWDYQKKQGVDQVKLEVPGINMDEVALFVSNRDLVVSALRYNPGNPRTIHCEYFFKMRLADDNDTNAVTYNYSNGILTIHIPRIKKIVKKLIPAFVYNKKVGMDEIKLELVGVKSGDVKYEIKDQTVYIRGPRFDESNDSKTLEAEYFFTIMASSENDLSALRGNLNGGILTICIPRKPHQVKEIVPVHIHEKRPQVDVLILELPGTKEDDVEIETVNKRLSVCAKRFDGDHTERSLTVIYKFSMDFQQNKLEETTSEFNNGILTLSIPRHTADVSNTE